MKSKKLGSSDGSRRMTPYGRSDQLGSEDVRRRSIGSPSDCNGIPSWILVRPGAEVDEGELDGFEFGLYYRLESEEKGALSPRVRLRTDSSEETEKKRLTIGHHDDLVELKAHRNFG
jgi:hypothetical protein